MTHTGFPNKDFLSTNEFETFDIANGRVIAKGFVDHSSKVYRFSHFMPFSNPSALLTHANEERKLWHDRFGHLKYKYLSNLCEKDMVSGLPKIKFSKGVCQGCILGKHPEHKYERVNHERTFAPLDIIHSEIAFHFPLMPMIQVKYVLTFIDNFSRYCWVNFLKLKFEVFLSLQGF